MKKFIVFITILAISVGVGFSWTYMEEFITEKLHPMKYVEYVEEYSELYGVPKEIIYAVIKCESSFEADAKSSKGAIGLMQIMPATFEDLCRRTGEEYNESLLYDPSVNIKYGTYYLSRLYSKFGIWETVYAAYNAGPGRVDDWLSNATYATDGRLHNIPIEETAGYVEKVSEARNVYAKLTEKYGGKVKTVPSNSSEAKNNLSNV